MKPIHDHQLDLVELVDDLAGSCYQRPQQLARWDGDLRSSGELDRRLADAGLFGIGLDGEEDHDGSLADVGFVLSAMGRHLAPAALMSSTMVVGPALMRSESTPIQELVARLGSGVSRAAMVAPVLSERPGDESIAMVHHDVSGAGLVLDGEMYGVLEGSSADALLVYSQSAGGEPSLSLVESFSPGLSVNETEMIDRSRGWASVVLDQVEVSSDHVVATGPAARTCVLEAHQRASVGIACDSLGIAEQAFEMTLQFVKQREQFNRPIGSFQAVKHRLVDEYSKLVGARACVRNALNSATGGRLDPGAVHVAKAYATSTAVQMTAEMVQLHGAIGFTWELGAHAFQKRALMNAHVFGDSDWHAEQFSRLQSPDPHRGCASAEPTLP